MPPRKRRNPIVPDYAPEALRLAAAADYRPRPSNTPSSDPTAGYGYAGWNQPAKPLNAGQKTQSYGGVGTQIFAGMIADEQYGIEEPEAWRGDNRWRTIAAMRRDGQAAAVTAVCLLPLLQASYNLNPASDRQEDVDVAQDVAENLLHGLQGGWHFLLRKFYRNRFEYGHFLGEKVWTVNPDGVRLRKIAERPAATIYRWFPDDDDELNRVMQRVWILDESGINGQWKTPIIPAEKLVISTRSQRGNDYRGESLFYPMWTHWDYKHKFYLIDGIAAERNGMGVPDMEEPPIVRQQSDRDLAAAALEAFRVGETAYMLRPNGYKFTLTGVSGQVRDIMPSIQHHDLMMSRSALAHFINLDAYGQLTISDSAQTLFLSAEEAESAEGIECINALIREWVDYNYESVDAYPTLAVTGIASRDLSASLRGIANLVTSGAITMNPETENVIRDDLDFPPLPEAPTPAGGGAPSVDPDVQGPAALPPGQAEQAPVVPGTTAEQQLSWKPPFSAGRLGERAIHLSGPRLRASTFTLRMSGAYREQPGAEYLARDDDGTEWICLARKVTVSGHRIPNPNTGDDYDRSDAAIRGMSHVLWRLGSGGLSGKHCPQCEYMARKGLMKLSELHIEPGSGDTWCDQNCTCTLEYRRAATVKVGK